MKTFCYMFYLADFSFLAPLVALETKTDKICTAGKKYVKTELVCWYSVAVSSKKSVFKRLIIVIGKEISSLDFYYNIFI